MTPFTYSTANLRVSVPATNGPDTSNIYPDPGVSSVAHHPALQSFYPPHPYSSAPPTPDPLSLPLGDSTVSPHLFGNIHGTYRVDVDLGPQPPCRREWCISHGVCDTYPVQQAAQSQVHTNKDDIFLPKTPSDRSSEVYVTQCIPVSTKIPVRNKERAENDQRRRNEERRVLKKLRSMLPDCPRRCTKADLLECIATRMEYLTMKLDNAESKLQRMYSAESRSYIDDSIPIEFSQEISSPYKREGEPIQQ